jgi:hypothetical protein
MITIPSPIVAVYSVDDKEPEGLRLVLAWDETGQPYVLGELALVLASTFPGFTGLRHPGSEPRDPATRREPVRTRPERPRIEERR